MLGKDYFNVKNIKCRNFNSKSLQLTHTHSKHKIPFCSAITPQTNSLCMMLNAKLKMNIKEV